MLPKTHPGTPDSYGITVMFVTGKTVDYQVVFHTWAPPQESPSANCLTIRTADDQIHVIERSSTLDVIFDRNWTKIVEMRSKLEAAKDAVK